MAGQNGPCRLSGKPCYNYDGASPAGTKWVCSAVVFVRFAGRAAVIGGLYYFVDGDGRILECAPGKDYRPFVFADAPRSEAEAARVADMTHSAGFAPWMAMSLMHCNNVEVRLAPELPWSMRRACEKRGGPVPLRHRTLYIAPMHASGAAAGPSRGEGRRMPVHTCRGHFKHFGPKWGAKLLFGKYEGTYWIESQVRGSKDAGEVVKGYTVGPGLGEAGP